MSNRLLVFVFFCFFASVFFFKGVTYLDADFGWHVRLGQYILAHGIPKTDPFSYTMPSYPFIDHEWLTNILLFPLFTQLGMVGTSAVFVVICFVAVGIQIPRKNLWLAVVPVVGALTILFPYFGVRNQVISWLFFSLLMKLLWDEKLWQRWRWTLPLIMLLWVNMHGSFLFGIVIVGLFIGTRIMRKQATASDIGVFLLSVGAMLLNPYGLRMLQESWVLASDENLHWRYGEWMPVIFEKNILVYCYFIFSVGFILSIRKKVRKDTLVCLVIILAAGISSIRHLPFFIIAAIPYTTQALAFWMHTVGKQKKQILLVKQVSWGLVTVIIGVCLLSMKIEYTRAATLTEEKAYPKDAVMYLREHMPQKNILSVYEWGGYLDWKLPEKKVFSDGRMPSWELKNPSVHESSDIFQEEEQLYSGDISLAQEVKKYDIDTVLFYAPVSEKEAKAAQLSSNEIFAPFFKQKKPRFLPLQDQLKQDGWKIVYQDTLAVVYKKE